MAGPGLNLHYQLPDLVRVYDIVNAGRRDHDFYCSLLPDQAMDVLDIGCGTGLFARRLADLGHRVTGLDPASGMLDLARTQPGAERVTWFQGTSATITAKSQFDTAIMTGHVFQCLLDDADISGLFQHVAAALKPNGQFMFETRNPAAKPWARWTPENARSFDLGDRRTVEIALQLDALEDGFVDFSETYRFSSEEEVTNPSRLRFLTLDQIHDFANQADFKLAKVWGDWDGAAYDQASSPEIICQLQAQGIAASRTKP